MTQVATGEVPIFPTFKNFRGQTVREVDSVGKESGGKFASAFSGAIGGIATAFAAIGVKQFFTEGIRGASELEQSVGAIGAIFKDSAGQMNQWSASAATDVGLTKNEFNELGSLIGAQLKNGGTAMDQLAPKTNDLITLGADLSSMFGGDTKSAVEALSSALKGERDPIERYGVSLNQAKIDAEAASLGFKKVGGTLSAEANQAATLSLIMKQTADAHGNFASEADTLAGKQQRLNAIWENGKTSIVGAFLPAVSTVTGWLVDKLPAAIEKAVGVSNKLVGTFDFIRGYISGEGSTADIGWLEKPATYIAETVIFLGVAGQKIADSITYIRGYMSGEGSTVDIGWLEKPAEFIADTLIKLQAALAPIGTAIGEAFRTGDLSSLQGLGDVFSGFMAIAQPSGPIIAEVGASIGEMSGEIGALVAGALPLLTPLMEGAAGVMSFLADNTGILTAVIVTLAGGFVALKAAQAAASVAAVGAVPTNIALAASNFAQASATRANTAATIAGTGATTTSTAAEKANLATRLASVGAAIRQGAAFVAQKAVLVAGAVATGVATAAQWAFNAAMSANPIALVVLAIAALVAGLVWFFTQTKLGQEIWANFTRFLGEAWANISQFFMETWTNISSFFVTVWEGIVTVFQTVWGLIVLYVQTYISVVQTIITTVINVIMTIWNTVWTGISTFFGTIWAAIVLIVTTYINVVQTIISTVVNVIVGIWTAVWGGISSFFAAIWSGIVAFVTTYINLVQTVITNVVNAISGTWNSVWSNISSFFQNIWKGITSAVSSFGDFFQGAFSGIAGFVTTAFNGVLGAVKAPINGIISLVNSAIDGLNGLSVSIPDWVPVVGGQTWGLSLPKIPRLAQGATVLPRKGGTMAILAEAGRAESVVDTGKMNRLLDVALNGGGGGRGGVTQNITNNFIDQANPVLAAKQANREFSKGLAAA